MFSDQSWSLVLFPECGQPQQNIGNGYCDDAANKPECNYDGGDCAGAGDDDSDGDGDDDIDDDNGDDDDDIDDDNGDDDDDIDDDDGDDDDDDDNGDDDYGDHEDKYVELGKFGLHCPLHHRSVAAENKRQASK